MRPRPAHRPGSPFTGCRRLLAGSLLAACACHDLIAPRTGSDRVLWRRPLESGRTPLGGLSTDGRLVFTSYRGITAFDPATGQTRWSLPLTGFIPRNVMYAAGAVYAAGSAVVAADAATGALLWNRPLSDGTTGDYAWNAVDAARVYVGTRDLRVIALERRTGALQWVTNVGPGWVSGLVSGLTVSGDTLYVTARRQLGSLPLPQVGVVMAMDAATGRVLWSTELSTDHGPDPAAGPDQTYFYAPPVVTDRLLIAADRGENSVAAFDRTTGALVWRSFGDAGFVGFTAAPVVAADTVFAASGDTHVYAFSLADGRRLWRATTPAANDWLVRCGRELLANYQGVAVIDPATGRVTERLLDADGEFAQSDFVTVGARALVFGNAALYAVSCRR